jgi:anti-anti-sigma regulatory factor
MSTAVPVSVRPKIVVDLSLVPMCDSGGLNVLLEAHRMAASRGGWLRLAAAQPFVRRVLELTNLTRALLIHGTVADAADMNNEAVRTRDRAAGSALSTPRRLSSPSPTSS